MKCPLVKSITPLGCLVNKLKHASCGTCPGIEGFKDDVELVRERLDQIEKPSGEPVAAKEPVGGWLIPLTPATIKQLQERNATPEFIASWVELYLQDKLCERRISTEPDPMEKSRMRPEG